MRHASTISNKDWVPPRYLAYCTIWMRFIAIAYKLSVVPVVQNTKEPRVEHNISRADVPMQNTGLVVRHFDDYAR